MEILDKIPFELDVEALLTRVHVKKESEDAEDIQKLVKAVIPVINPKVVYEISYIQYKNYDKVDIGGVVFTSHILRVNLDKVERVFPFISTCGKELDEVDVLSDNFMRQFWMDTIKEMVLRIGINYFRDYLKRKYALGEISSMSPGAGPADLWPIEQQKQLFSIFGDVESLIGVRLTDSFLMIPNKSVSGIIFSTEIKFETCKLCPREKCPGRKAPYDKNISASYYKDRI